MPATLRDADPRRLEDLLGRIERTLVAADADDAVARPLRALDATLVVATGDGEDVAVRFGPETIESVADDDRAGPRVVVLRGEPDVLDRVWRGALHPATAIGNEELAAEGPVNLILRVCAHLPNAAATYRRVLRRDIAAAQDAAELVRA